MPHDLDSDRQAVEDPRPRPPSPPDPGDCCGEGCPRCVYDVHEARLERYRKALAAWLERHPENEADGT